MNSNVETLESTQNLLYPIAECLEDYIKNLGDGSRQLIGIETRMNELDTATLGIDGLVVLGGVSGKGKTTYALQLAYQTCELGTPVLFYSLEMSRDAILTKIFNRLSRVKYKDIVLKGKLLFQDDNSTSTDTKGRAEKEGTVSLKETEKLREARHKFQNVSDRFYIRTIGLKEREINFTNLEEDIHTVQSEHKTKKPLVVIDHLQVFPVEDSSYSDRLEKENISIRKFKRIAEETGAVILLISQKNKSGSDVPGLNTIKGSVDIVYLADLVMLLEDNANNQNSKPRHSKDVVQKLKLIIEKGRFCGRAEIDLFFDGEYSTFEEVGN